MTGIICYKNKTYGKFNDATKFKYDKIDSILLELHSHMFGKAYIKLSPESFKKCKDFNNIKLSYKFYNGRIIDSDSENYLEVKSVFRYKSVSSLFSKILEMVISEMVLNDSFWVHDCYYCYCYDDIKITAEDNDSKTKFRYLNAFFKYTKINDEDYLNSSVPKFITFNNKKWNKYNSYDKLKNKLNLIHYADQYYFEVNKKFYKKIKSASFFTKLSLCEFDDSDNFIELGDEIRMDYKYKRSKNGDCSSISNFIVARFGPDIIESVNCTCDSILYKLESKMKRINKKKSHMPMTKFMKKYFHIEQT